jgi:hypothetical protein
MCKYTVNIDKKLKLESRKIYRDQVNILGQNDQLINDILYDKYLFCQDSLNLFLNVDYKSIFVRRAFKRLLQTHLIELINEQGTKSVDRIGFICSTFAQMSIEIRMNNLDVFTQVYSHFLFSPVNQSFSEDKVMPRLLQLHSSSRFSIDKPDYLIHSNHLTSEYTIESFAHAVCFDLLFLFVDKNSGSMGEMQRLAEEFRNQNVDILFYQIFLKVIFCFFFSFCWFWTLKAKIELWKLN